MKIQAQSNNKVPVSVQSDVLIAVVTKSSTLWGITLCKPTLRGKHLVSNFSVKQGKKGNSIKAEGLLATCFKLVYCLAYSSTLKMEATCYSETSVDFNGFHGVIPQKTKLFSSRCSIKHHAMTTSGAVAI
jgi:hypothetical protein